MRPITAAALAVALMLSGPALVAADEARGVLLRLELRGDIPSGDSFTLGVTSSDGTIIDIGHLCGPGSELYQPEFVPCAPGVYEWGSTGDTIFEVGTVLTYSFARVPAAGGDEVLYQGSVTVSDEAHVRTVVYDYGGGAVLPDTSMPLPTPVPLAWLIALIAAAVVGAAHRQWVRPSPPTT